MCSIEQVADLKLHTYNATTHRVITVDGMECMRGIWKFLFVISRVRLHTRIAFPAYLVMCRGFSFVSGFSLGFKWCNGWFSFITRSQRNGTQFWVEDRFSSLLPRCENRIILIHRDSNYFFFIRNSSRNILIRDPFHFLAISLQLEIYLAIWLN